MADQESENSRPRRALGDTDPNLTRVPGPKGDADRLDPDERRPLYRDEGPAGEQATQLLPRTQRRGSSRSDFDAEDDPDRIVPGRRGLGRRARWTLLIAAVAAVVVAGLAIGYSVLNPPNDPALAPGPDPGATSTAGGPAGASSDPAALLTDTMMLTAAQAKPMLPGRSWKVASTQRGLDDQSPVPACVPAVGEGPAPQQTILRLLSSSGKNPPGALHQADAYGTAQEAGSAYALLARALGGCAMPGAYLQSGYLVSGVGDQATAAVVHATADNGAAEYRSVLVSRVGRVVNLLDVAQPGTAAPVAGLARSLAAASRAQCRAAGGRCGGAVAVKEGPPPPGGDQPGFLAAGDLPPVGSRDATWAGTVPTRPSPDFAGSGCETTNWASVSARQRATRTYLLADNNPKFGLDDILITSASNQAARALAAKVKADLDSCSRRKLTATVSGLRPVRGVGAAGVPVAGWAGTVLQRTTAGAVSYRVGVVSAGNKTAFTFLNPQPKLNLSDAQWAMVVVRAGQRATQAK